MFCHRSCFGSRKINYNCYSLNDDLSLAGISLKARKWQISQAERKVWEVLFSNLVKTPR